MYTVESRLNGKWVKSRFEAFIDLNEAIAKAKNFEKFSSRKFHVVDETRYVWYVTALNRGFRYRYQEKLGSNWVEDTLFGNYQEAREHAIREAQDTYRIVYIETGEILVEDTLPHKRVNWVKEGF